MSDIVVKPGTIKIGGLGRQAQKLQAAKEKAANVKSGAKPGPGASASSFKASSSSAGIRKPASNAKPSKQLSPKSDPSG